MFHLAFERRLSPRTVAAYRADLEAHLGTLRDWGLVRPEQVRPDHLREYLAGMHDRGRAARSRLRARSTLRGFYRYLTREGELPSDPARDLEAPRLGRALPQTLSPDDVDRLIQAAGGPKALDRRDRALLELAYGCGLRVSELVQLGSEEVDLRERWLRVRGKGNKERQLPLGRQALESLRRYLHGPRATLLRNRQDPGTVFLNSSGGKLSRMGFWKILRRRAVLAGMPAERIHPHLLRHSYATHLLQGGASLRVVQELLGHRNLKTTEVYTAVDRDYLRKIHHEFHPRG